MPAQVADRYMNRVLERRRSTPSLRPEFNEAGSLREIPGSTTDWPAHADVAMTDHQDPLLWQMARKVSSWKLSSAARSVRSSTQRARHGWSSRDAYNAGHHVAAVTAGLLEEMANTLSGWPSGDDYPTADSWESELQRNAAALRRMSDSDPEAAAALDHWFNLAGDPSADPDAVAGSFDLVVALEEEREAAVKAALHWVADNVYNLWD